MRRNPAIPLALCGLLVLALVLMLGCAKPADKTSPAPAVQGAKTGGAAIAGGPKPATPPVGSAGSDAKATPESTTGEPALKVGTTLENLQAAFDGESNAHAKYLEFAKKADEEGYKQVAVLFRATARAEEIHAANHKGVIEKLGGTAKADIKPAEVKSTKENLEAALKGETYEKETMYPGFITVAKTDKNAEAIKTLNGAMKVEAAHATLYKDALDNLESMKAVTGTMSVCPVCGYTVKKVDFEECPICATDGSKFETIK
jgi:rubrerythrin